MTAARNVSEWQDFIAVKKECNKDRDGCQNCAVDIMAGLPNKRDIQSDKEIITAVIFGIQIF